MGSGGRAEQLLGPIGLLMFCFLLFFAVVRLSRARQERGSGTSDPLGLEPDDAAGGGAASPLRSILPDFAAVLDSVVRPRRQAYPDWERLDGAIGVPGRTIASFERNGAVYNLNGETSFAALDAVDRWMQENPGEDPFITLPARRGVGRLGARPEIGWTDQKALRIETG